MENLTIIIIIIILLLVICFACGCSNFGYNENMFVINSKSYNNCIDRCQGKYGSGTIGDDNCSQHCYLDKPSRKKIRYHR